MVKFAQYAVGHMNYDDISLKIELIPGFNWKSALKLHSQTCNEDVDVLSDDLETAKEEAIGMEWEFDVVEIKEE